MQFTEIGFKEGKTLMLLPGTCCDYQTNFANVLGRLEEKYHLICVNYDGFDGNDEIFSDMITVTEKIEQYIIDNHNGRLDGALGSSLGCSFVGQLIQRERVHIDHGIFGSPDLDQSGKLSAKLQAKLVDPLLTSFTGSEKKRNKTRQKLEDFFLMSDEAADRFMECFAKFDPESIRNEYYTDLITYLDEDIHVDNTQIHFIYANKMGKKYLNRYRKYFRNPEIREFDMQHEQWLFGGDEYAVPVLKAIDEFMEEPYPERYYIEKNTVQETLMIPLIGRKVCSDHYPHLFADPEAERILGMLDYDLAPKLRKMETAPGLFGALEVAQRQYDLAWEICDYLKDHPDAAVVNMGCGLDDTFRKCDNGRCKGYNIDMPDVIEVRNKLLPAGERESNISHNLNDFAWMDLIDASGGAVFYASGVFYYFRTEDVKKLFAEMSRRFPGGVIVFDCCNSRGAGMMTKTWLKEAGISDVDALFSLENSWELKEWNGGFAEITSKSYMRGYRDIYSEVSRFHKLMIRFCDKLVKMVIVKIRFKQSL